ncbi:MAG: D-alanyl-D-alanine carboxypeptidase/D-alanyl-D-alanine-endopeptidase [Lewinellaceae bacterium]|nr:D-alanyl-D-alanine carboxypeptidase/D-alanyl-D-alanine-endopeptidase [Lewinellaceae bacterium]
MLRYSFLFLLISTVLTASAQNAYQAAANRLAADPSLKNGSLSISVIDVESGRLLASNEPERSLSPASNLKILATASALVLLGPDYRFQTRLECDDALSEEGVLSGNLYLSGFGDPTLGSPLMEGALPMDALLERLRMAVQQAGIRRIEGNVVGDASAFGSNSSVGSWQWEDMGNYYGAGAWALNMHENLHYLLFQQQGELGATPPIVRIEPEVFGLKFINEVASAARGSGDNAYIFGAPYQFNRYVRGTIPVGSGIFTIKGSIPNPPLFAAQWLRQSLAMVGILSAGASNRVSGRPGSGRRQLYTHYSPPLSDIVNRTNMESVNLYCEAMAKVIGWEKRGEGSTAAGLETIRSYWEEQGLNLEGCYLSDGSGLSEANAVTSLFLARLLRLMALKEEAFFRPFYESLPLAGRSGSLKNTLKGTAAEGNLRAKTGTLERVRALSGYATARNGRLLAFSIIVNNYAGSGGAIRQKMERFMLELCKN